jgi:hypothetical protein
MKVNSPLRWRIVELLSWLQCWTGDLAACGRRWTTPD